MLKKFILKFINSFGYRIEKINRQLQIPLSETEQIKFLSEDNKYIFYQYNGYPIKLRHYNSSDYEVLKQIFVHEEYKFVKSYFENNQINPKTMIDAGANIGLTSIYFKNRFPQLQIIAIEPEVNNFEMLQCNLSSYQKDASVKCYNAGLLGKSGLSLEIGNDFRDGSDWAKQTKITDNETTIKSITIPDLIIQNQIEIIDFLKIDIEGAETFLLEGDTDLSFLEKTKIIAIEIHDEYNCREGIYQLLGNKGFILLNFSETTLGIRQDFIK